MKNLRRALTALMTLALILALAPAALADRESSGKEEVVYINLDPTGAVSTVDVVNIFDMPAAGRIVDHGDYSSVRNMTTTDALTLSDGTVTADVGPGKLYYEGRLENASIPWLVSIRYYLDGQELDAEDLAGESGALEIRLTAARNTACAGTFFDDYALQISFTLDGDKCDNIAAPGATVANVGGDKQLTYTVLPGMGADISFTADVTDFAMDPIALNGVRLSLDVPLGDGSMSGGLDQAGAAILDLDRGLFSLENDLAALTGQSKDLTGGLADVQAALDKLGDDPEAQEALDALAQALEGYTRAVQDAYLDAGEVRQDADWLTTASALLTVLGPTMGEDAGELSDTLAGVTGAAEPPTSFASAENGTVASVQFVLRTPAIEKPAPAEAEPTPAPEQTFWEKLAALF